jgi:hypothetical protein
MISGMLDWGDRELKKRVKWGDSLKINEHRCTKKKWEGELLKTDLLQKIS